MIKVGDVYNGSGLFLKVVSKGTDRLVKLRACSKDNKKTVFGPVVTVKYPFFIFTEKNKVTKLKYLATLLRSLKYY